MKVYIDKNRKSKSYIFTTKNVINEQLEEREMRSYNEIRSCYEVKNESRENHVRIMNMLKLL